MTERREQQTLIDLYLKELIAKVAREVEKERIDGHDSRRAK